MEHIFSLFGGKTEHDEVPFVATKDYQDVPFLEYLDYSGKRPLWEKYQSAPANQLGRLIQTWLFFGLLQEVLGRFFVHEDFVETRLQPDGSEKLFVTTAKLLEVIRERDKYVSKHPMSSDEVSRLRQCINIFRARLRERADLRASILSIMCLQSALLAASTGWENECIGSTSGFSLAYPTISDVDLEIMAGQGWCRYLAASAWQSVESIGTKMFLRTQRGQLPVGLPNSRDHSECSRARCLHVQIKPATYVVAHVDGECACSMFSVSSQSVAEVLDQGAIPLIEAHKPTETDDWSFAIVPSGPDTPYVALSHVWADGLGNPGANELPCCKLDELAQKVRKLVTGIKLVEAGNSKFWFWLDSLLCPVGPPALKSRAIAEMRRTYREARIVLVLDSYLEQLNLRDSRWSERAILLLTSRWMRRLWTFQEGGLARTVYFRVKNTFYALRRVLRMCMNEEGPGNVVYRDLAMDADLLFSPFSYLFQDEGIHAKMLSSKTGLFQIVKSVALRDVSVASDEGICLSAVIGQDSPGVEDFEGHNMARFWRMCVEMGLTDADSVFNVLPKLSVAGFRWAPRTLLYSKHGLTMTKTHLHGTSVNDVQLRLHDDQVAVDLPGMMLAVIGDTRAFFSQQSHGSKRSTWVRTAVEPHQWYQIEMDAAEGDCSLPTLVDEPPCLAIILRSSDGRECLGKLVLVTARDNGMMSVESVATCWVSVWPLTWTDCVDKAINDIQACLPDLDEVWSKTRRFFSAVGVDVEQERALAEQNCIRYATAAKQSQCLQVCEILPESQTWVLN